MQFKLSVVVLVFNEIKTLEQAIKDAKSIKVPDKEIIVVDNCSTDGSREYLKSLNDPSVRIIFNKKNYGPGGSVEIGIRESNGEFIYIQHADLEYDHNIVPKMVELSEKENYDMVMGSRIQDHADSVMKLLKERPEYFATIVATNLINYWYDKKFTDVIGSRLYRTSSVRKIPVSSHGTGFEFEHTSRLIKRGFKVHEILVGYKPRAAKEDKKIKPYNMINAIFALFRVRYLE